MNRHLQTVCLCQGAWLAAAVLLLAARPAAAAGTSTNAAPANPVNAAFGLALPQSEFVNDPAVGRDPFYPGSTRRAPIVRVVDKKSSPVANPDRSGLLTLLGITGPAERRIALINNSTFVLGENGTVRTTSGPLKLRVVEILEKTVRIVIDGDVSPRELRLREINSNAIQIQTSKVEPN